VPVAPDPAAGEPHRVLLDDRARVLARFREDRRNQTVHADLFTPEPGVVTEELVPVVLRELAGHRVTAPQDVGMALLRAGGTAHRHFHLMHHSLEPLPPLVAPPPGVDMTPVDRTPADIAPAMMAAYPPGHVDHEEGDTEIGFVVGRVVRLMSGRDIGPLLSCSRLAVAMDGRVVGGALVNLLEGRAPFGGPWVGEMFRDPAWPGTGPALVTAVLHAAAADGQMSVGLAVTHGNERARALYERVGFSLVRTFLNVDVPAAWLTP
jgi:GNAT superfamily N-acetyltransferase